MMRLSRLLAAWKGAADGTNLCPGAYLGSGTYSNPSNNANGSRTDTGAVDEFGHNNSLYSGTYTWINNNSTDNETWSGDSANTFEITNSGTYDFEYQNIYSSGYYNSGYS